MNGQQQKEVINTTLLVFPFYRYVNEPIIFWDNLLRNYARKRKNVTEILIFVNLILAVYYDNVNLSNVV